MSKEKKDYTKRRILGLLADGKPSSSREIIEESNLSKKAVECSLYRLWREYLILRSDKPKMETQRIFKGRGGISRNLRKYHLYVLKPEEADTLRFQEMRFVKYDGENFEKTKPEQSKSKVILEFLERNKDKAFFSKDIAEALKHEGIKPLM